MDFFRGCFVALPLSVLVWLGVVFAVVSCSTTEPAAAPAFEPARAAPRPPAPRPPAPRPSPMLDELRGRALGDGDATPALALRALAEADFAPAEARFASVTVRHAPRLADVAGGLPLVVDWQRRPIAGEPWSCAWVTSYLPPRPDAACALLVTLRPPPTPRPIPGAAGAMLQVPPDYVLAPERVAELGAAARPGRLIDFVQDRRGRVRLYVAWPRELAGLSVWLQLLVADARVPAGCVPAPMLELHVGER